MENKNQKPEPESKREPVELIQNTDQWLHSCLDQKIIEKINRIGPDFLQELVEIFIEQAPVLMSEMCEAHENEDRERLLHLIDQLRGGAANLGIMKLDAFCREMISTLETEGLFDFDNFFDRLIYSDQVELLLVDFVPPLWHHSIYIVPEFHIEMKFHQFLG